MTLLLDEKKQRRGLRERRAYVVLVFISICLSVATYVFAVRAINAADHKFCDIISATTSTPVPAPTDPAKDPSRERAYIFYLKFKELDRNLGC